MASSLKATTLTINGTQPITGIKTTLNNSDSEVPTSKAVKDFVDNLSKPVSLSVVGNWTNPQYISQAVDTTGLSFIVTYGSGKTASVTPSVSPSSWSSTVGTQTATFSYTEHGVTVSATKSASVVEPHNWSSWKKVGGTIFYINSSSTTTYEFKNDSGTVVSAPSVGTDCTNWTYRYDLNEYTADKFYVYESATGRVHIICWGYIDKATSATGNSIGAGKINTSTVLAITDTSTHTYESIWEHIKNMRTNKVNGCDDWFVGCDAEYDVLKSSGTPISSKFPNLALWSSRERSASYASCYDGGYGLWRVILKSENLDLIPLRAF